MTTLANYNHDFPRLAKQSGFYFQLHRGKVNWAEIENLNVNEIIEDRNFELLERNLINVVNCNLDREYDLKILDRNFVKLFKIAQLGVDYLSYCETYLDKCVIILQEQLIAFQEECESLKFERDKRKEDNNRYKRKTKTQSFQCEKCDKAFISDVYLKFHDKRRHGSPNTSDRSAGRCKDSYQQTEKGQMVSTSTQTVFPQCTQQTVVQTSHEPEEIKTQHAVKIHNLEQEIQNLKERLKKAETALTEKAEAPKATACHSPFSGAMCHANTMLLLLPSHQPQSASVCREVSPGWLVSTPEIPQSHSHTSILSKAEESTPDKGLCSSADGRERDLRKEENNPPLEKNAKPGGFEREPQERLECDVENTEPNTEEAVEVVVSRPLPPPRKSKRLTEGGRMGEPLGGVLEGSIECKGGGSPVITARSTPLKGKSGEQSEMLKGLSESISDINARQSTSNDSLSSRKTIDDHRRSFFRAVVGRSSPKFESFRRHLRRSLTNLRDSVSSATKDSKKGAVEGNLGAAVADGVESELRGLGVDPEWSGIPKKTMKDKLKLLKHRRKLLAKENPTYPAIRRSIEQTILQKLTRTSQNNKTDFLHESTKDSLDETPAEDALITPHTDNTPLHTPLHTSLMYHIQPDSDSETSDSEVDLRGQKEPSGAPKEFDLSVFQVGRGRTEERSVRVEELVSESEEGKWGGKERGEEGGSGGESPRRAEKQSILKGALGFQSRLQVNGKKKVWFGNSCNDMEEGLSDSPTEDESMWSVKNDWEKDVG